MNMQVAQNNNVYSSIRGKITVLSVAVTDLDGTDQYNRILALLHTSNPDTGLLVWCNSQSAMQNLDQWLQKQGVKAQRRFLNEQVPAIFKCVLLAPQGQYALTNYTHWIRDPFLWKQEPDGALSLLGSAFAKNEDSLWAMLHLRHLQLEHKKPVRWQKEVIPAAGGNILFDEDFILVGARQFQAHAAKIGRETCIQNLFNALNGPQDPPAFRRIIEIGKNAPQEPAKLAHIDLYLSITGRREQNRYVVLLGKCVLLANVLAPSPAMLALTAQLNTYLDNVGHQLETAGFCVKRNPMPIVPGAGSAQPYLCAYNNCLLEVGDFHATVWLAQLSFGQEAQPFYDQLKHLELENIALWESLDFEVRLVAANFHSILDDQGSLHCITNEVLRN